MKKTLKQGIKSIIRGVNKLRVSEAQINNRLIKMNHDTGNRFLFPSPSVPWGYLFQRPQQMAVALSRLGNQVIYSVEGEYKIQPDRSTIGLKGVNRGLYLYNDYSSGHYLDKLEKVIVWRYWANHYNYPKTNTNNHINIYDWIDDIEVYGYSKEEINWHYKLVEEADILLTTAQNIYEKASHIRGDAILLPNACDYDFFSKPPTIRWPQLDKLRNNYETIIGYYGAISEWLDFELIEYCARKNPNWLFLIVGQVYPSMVNQVNTTKPKNIVVWDRVAYEKLPYLLSKFDVATIPFRINDITQATSPVKIYEYLAGGKPVVSTSMKEVIHMNCALIAKNKYEFNSKIEEALELNKNQQYINGLRKIAKENSWLNRANFLLDILKERRYI